MKLRRVRTDDGIAAERLGDDGQWHPHADLGPLGGNNFDERWLRETADLHDSDQLLPFQPLSFCDFLLYEKHNIDASRGLVRRFHPGQYRATAIGAFVLLDDFSARDVQR